MEGMRNMREFHPIAFVVSRACPELVEGNHDRKWPERLGTMGTPFDRLRANG